MTEECYIEFRIKNNFIPNVVRRSINKNKLSLAIMMTCFYAASTKRSSNPSC